MTTTKTCRDCKGHEVKNTLTGDGTCAVYQDLVAELIPGAPDAIRVAINADSKAANTCPGFDPTDEFLDLMEAQEQVEADIKAHGLAGFYGLRAGQDFPASL